MSIIKGPDISNWFEKGVMYKAEILTVAAEEYKLY